MFILKRKTVIYRSSITSFGETGRCTYIKLNSSKSRIQVKQYRKKEEYDAQKTHFCTKSFVYPNFVSFNKQAWYSTTEKTYLSIHQIDLSIQLFSSTKFTLLFGIWCPDFKKWILCYYKLMKIVWGLLFL